MAQLDCPCGAILSNGLTPSGTVGTLVTSNDREAFYVSKGVDECLSALSRSRDVWECHQCGRLAVTCRTGLDVKWYAPEDGKPGAVMEYRDLY